MPDMLKFIRSVIAGNENIPITIGPENVQVAVLAFSEWPVVVFDFDDIADKVVMSRRLNPIVEEPVATSFTNRNYRCLIHEDICETCSGDSTIDEVCDPTNLTKNCCCEPTLKSIECGNETARPYDVSVPACETLCNLEWTRRLGKECAPHNIKSESYSQRLQNSASGPLERTGLPTWITNENYKAGGKEDCYNKLGAQHSPGDPWVDGDANEEYLPVSQTKGSLFVQTSLNPTCGACNQFSPFLPARAFIDRMPMFGPVGELNAPS
jgi:hypothetical protein